jgi:hypothetical protein
MTRTIVRDDCYALRSSNPTSQDSIHAPQAESSAEARRTVMDMFPGAVVTGVHRIK